MFAKIVSRQNRFRALSSEPTLADMAALRATSRAVVDVETHRATILVAPHRDQCAPNACQAIVAATFPARRALATLALAATALAPVAPHCRAVPLPLPYMDPAAQPELLGGAAPGVQPPSSSRAAV